MMTIIEAMTAANAVELLSVVWVEVTMASLAALLWFSVSGSIMLPKGSKKFNSDQGKSIPGLPCAGGSEPCNPLQKASTALRQGRLSEGIALVLQLSETLAGCVPASIAPRLLMAVAKASNFEEALAELGALAGKVEARALEAAILQASKQNDVAACRQLQLLSAPMLISKTPRALEALARVYASDVNMLRILVEDAEAPLAKCFAGAILEACAAMHEIDLAVDVFEKVAEVDAAALRAVAEKASQSVGKPGAEKSPKASYHGLLNDRVCAHDQKGAWKLVEAMRAEGVLPNMITCSILLKCKSNGANEVSRILKLVDATEQKMDDIFFATVVEACARTNCFDLLSEQTAKFAREGGSLALTAPTYGSMIKAYGQMWDVKRVWELWGEMTSNSVQPTAITLGCMVEALVSNLRTAEAWQLAEQMLKEDSTRSLVNTVIYSTIIKGFAQMKDIGKVMTLYDQMRAHGCQANTITYNTILNAFAQSGAMDRVPALLEDMKTASPPVEPDIVTYSTLVKGFCNSGCLDHALQIVEEMQASGKNVPETGERNARRAMHADEVMYNSLLDGCAKEQRPDDALKLFGEMKKAGVPPSNYTLSMLVKIMGRCRRLNQAFALIDEITSEYNVKVNIQVYTCLITACFNNRQAFKAIAVHDQIIKEGLQPDEMTYSVLVQGCLKAGLVDKAVQLAKCACGVGALKGNGVRPGIGERCLAELMSALGGSGSCAAKSLKAELGECCKAPKGKGKGSSKGSGPSGPRR